MKVFGEIATDLNYFKTIRFEKEYFERYVISKQTGPDFVVDFELRILPAKKDTITVYWIEDGPTKQCIQYIFEGIGKFVGFKNRSSIGVDPFDIVISNAIIHPVDFKPARHVTYTCSRLNEIAFEIGTKLVKHNSEPLRLNEADSNNTALTSLTSYYDILLPNRKMERIKLPSGYRCYKKFEIEKSYGETPFIIFSATNNNIDFRNINRLEISFAQNVNGISSFLSLIDGLTKIVNDIYESGYDLGGLKICILDSNLKGRAPEFSEHMYWFLKELLVHNNEVDFL